MIKLFIAVAHVIIARSDNVKLVINYDGSAVFVNKIGRVIASDNGYISPREADRRMAEMLPGKLSTAKKMREREQQYQYNIEREKSDHDPFNMCKNDDDLFWQMFNGE